MVFIQDVLTVSISVGTTTLFVLGILSKDVGGKGALGPTPLFSWHVVGMCVGFCGFMATGLYSYQLEGLPRAKGRHIHAVLNMLGTVGFIYGYVAIYRAHAAKGVSQFVAPTTMKQVHVVLGYLVLFLCFLQVFAGLLKYAKALRFPGGPGLLKWHGKLGYVIVLLGFVNIGIAVRFWSWSTGLQNLMLAALTLNGVTALVPGIVKQVKNSFASPPPPLEEPPAVRSLSRESSASSKNPLVGTTKSDPESPEERLMGA